MLATLLLACVVLVDYLLGVQRLKSAQKITEIVEFKNFNKLSLWATLFLLAIQVGFL